MPLRILVVLGGAIAAAIVGVVYPYIGLLTLEMLTFGRPQDDRPNVAVLHIPLMIVIAITVGMLLRFQPSMKGVLAALKRLWIMLALYVLMALSAFNNWTPLSNTRLYDFTTLLFLCVVSLALVTNEKRLRGYIGMMVLCGTYIVIRVLRNPSHIHEGIGGEDFERIAIAKGGTVFGNSNYLALMMVLTIFLCIGLMGIYRKLWQRSGIFAVMAGAGYVFFRANSRGASLALASGILILWLMNKRKGRTALVLAIFIGLATFLAPDSYWDRLSTIVNYQEDRSAMGRLELWDIALDLIPQHPILGVGPDNFTLYAPNTPHDAYLQIGCEVGIPALIVYIMLLAAGLYSAWRARWLSAPIRNGNPYIYAVSQGVFCCVLAIVVQGFTTGLAHREVVYGFYMIALCLETHARNFKAETKPVAEPAGETFMAEASFG